MAPKIVDDFDKNISYFIAINSKNSSGIDLKQSSKNEKQMKKNVRSHMVYLQKNPKKVVRFFRHKSIKYADA